jgi:hypothetical protein
MKDIPEARSAFSSAALGTLYFYDKIETVAPVSRKTSEALGKTDFDLMILDRQSPEVRNLLGLLERSNAQLKWSFPDMMVLLKKTATGPSSEYLAAKIPEPTESDWQTPKAEVVWLHHKPWYGLKQPPGEQKISRLDFEAQGSCLSFMPAIRHPPVSGKGDGAGFSVIGRDGEGSRLLYSRFLKKGSGAETEIPVRGLTSMSLITNAGPRGDFSFDDAFWLEAKFSSECGPREKQ